MDVMSGVRTIIFSSKALWGLFGVAFFVWIGMTAVILYHWNTYAKGDARVHKMKYVYFIGSALLLGSVLSFIFSL